MFIAPSNYSGLAERRTALQVEGQISRKMTYMCTTIAVILIPIVVLISQYHGLGTDILGLKILAVLNLDSPAQVTELADLCARIQRYDCSALSFRHGTQKFSNNLDLWLGWAKMETNHKNIEGAIVAYRGYFANGGADYQVHYHFAKDLQDAGHNADAIVEYQKMLDAADPKVLQVTVAENLVRLLIQEKRLDDALAVIEKFHKQGDNAKEFLNVELAKVRELHKG